VSVNNFVSLRSGLALAALLLGGLAPLSASISPAHAAPPLSCVNTIYAVNNFTEPIPGTLTAIDTSAQTSATVPGPQIGDNALGVSADGLFTYSYNRVTNRVVVENVLTGTTQTFFSTAGGDVIRGAVNPANGFYYFADAFVVDTTIPIDIFAFNTTSNTFVGKVGVLAPDAIPIGLNGDLVFDTAGNMYVTIGDHLYRGNVQLPTTASNAPVGLTTLAVLPQGVNIPGVAISSDGFLYVSDGSQIGPTTIFKIDPSNGASAGSFTIPQSYISDLGSCASPNTLTLSKNVQGRSKPGDQFGMAITGSGISNGNTATTSGSTDGVQAEVAGPVLTLSGNTYSINQAGAGTTDLGNYVTTWVCTDVNTGAVVASGTGNSGTFTYPPPSGPRGGNVQCVFTDVAIPTDFKSVNPASTTAVVASEDLTYTLAFTGTSAGGPVNRVDNISGVLDDATIVLPPESSDPVLTVTDGSNGLIGITGTLKPDQTVTVTYTVKVKPDGQRGDDVLDNFLLDPGETPPATCEPSNDHCTTNPVTSLTLAAAGSNELLPIVIGAGGVFAMGSLTMLAGYRLRRHQ